ncbi:hypothetical protein ACK3ZW_01820 [Aeromonas caviae]
MRSLKETLQDGYKCNGHKPDLELAFISLKIALTAYSSTYKELQHHLSPILLGRKVDYMELSKNKKYQILYTETIIHFQHFFELTLKHFLRNSHPLLSDKIPYDNSLLLYKILNNQNLSHNDSMNIESIEFGETIRRIKTLHSQIPEITALGLTDSDFTTLSELNKLRNRVWHRGLFILNYNALDEFMCRFVFPTLTKILETDSFKSTESAWKYQRLACSLDPLHELLHLSKSPSIDFGKLSMLKELCRAAYNNPLDMKNLDDEFIHEFENDMQRERYVKFAETNASEDLGDVTTCPVCKTPSLVKYFDDEIDIETGEMIDFYVGSISCTCCDFSLVRGFKNAHEYNLDGISNFDLI